jgi:hypothetical protein
MLKAPFTSPLKIFFNLQTPNPFFQQLLEPARSGSFASITSPTQT